jgi:hypothetical protein
MASIEVEQASEAMRRMAIAVDRLAYSFTNRGWKPWSWYSTSERTR